MDIYRAPGLATRIHRMVLQSLIPQLHRTLTEKVHDSMGRIRPVHDSMGRIRQVHDSMGRIRQVPDSIGRIRQVPDSIGRIRQIAGFARSLKVCKNL